MEKPSFEEESKKKKKKTGTEGIEFEMEMIRYTLLKNPENQKLSPEQ